MKFKKRLTLFLGIIIFFTSCQKEINGLDTPIPSGDSTVVISDSSYLDKLILLADNSVDTFEVETFNYDANKRVISITDTTKYLGVVSAGYYKYFYNGDDTLPFKEIYVNTFEQFDSSVTYIFYDNAGKKIADSSWNLRIDDVNDTFQFGFVTHYKYEADKLIGDSKYITVLNGLLYVDKNIDTATVDASGNILRIVKNRPDLGPNGEAINEVYDYNYAYDNHINPYFKLNIMMFTQPFFEFGNSISKNNWLTGNDRDDGVGDPMARIKYNFTYTYNLGNLPIFFKEDITTTYGNETETYIYKYRAL